MQVEQSLRIRVIAACVFFAVVVGGVFAAAAFVLIESVEHELIDRRLSRAMPRLMEGLRNGTAALPPMDLRFVSGAQLPAALNALAPGLHVVKVDGRVQHALIDTEGGVRFALIDDASDFARIEHVANIVLAIGFAAGILLAVGIGQRIASRVIAPVSLLARAVAEDSLARHPELLGSADEIGVLARAFDARTGELQSALSRERLFTADVSHELRTPLAVMLGAAELLVLRLAGRADLNPEIGAAAERIRRNAGDMAARVSALLQLARAPETLGREPLEMRAVVQRELDRCRPLLQGKPVHLRVDAPEPVWLRASGELAAVALDNLLRNACTFTQEGEVLVRLRPDGLEIEDTGPGVPEAVRERLFERFVRGRDDGRGGSGLGLSIVKRVAEHQGWKVRLDRRTGGGSRFTIAFGPTGVDPVTLEPGLQQSDDTAAEH